MKLMDMDYATVTRSHVLVPVFGGVLGGLRSEQARRRTDDPATPLFWDTSAIAAGNGARKGNRTWRPPIT